MLNQLKLVYGPFGQGNMHSNLDFCPTTARKETNVPLKANVREKVLFSRTDFLPWEILLIKKLDFEKTKPT